MVAVFADVEAAVRPELGAADEVGSEKVALYVATKGEKMFVALDGEGFEATLVEVAVADGASKSAQAFDYMICLSPDGSRLALSSESERGVDIWGFKTGTRLYSLPEEPGTVYWLAWSHDGRRVAVARDNGKIAIWDLHIVDEILARLGLQPVKS